MTTAEKILFASILSLGLLAVNIILGGTEREACLSRYSLESCQNLLR